MLLPLRTFIISLLVMLQLIAPLVHAHTGEQIFNTGLHIPGLETLDRAYATDATTLLQTVSSHDTEGQLIGVNTGLKAKYSNMLDDDNDSPVYIIPTAVIIKTRLSPFDSNFSPQLQHLVTQHANFAHSARAPPQHAPA